LKQVPEEMPETNWFIIKTPSEQCQIVSAQSLNPLDPEALDPQPTEQWGPFKTQNQAIAKRIGLIRAGKCKPS
jgi:hypothetical protein